MDCHDPHLIRTRCVHVAFDLAATAADACQKLKQGHAAAKGKILRQIQEVIERFINRTAKPVAEFLAATIDKNKAEKTENRLIFSAALPACQLVGHLAQITISAAMRHQP